MIKNHLKIAWRNILRNKALFSINIAGLAIGIATSFIILLFIFDELSYDRYNEKADQIVRVVFRGKINGEIVKEAVTPGPTAATLQQEFPEVLMGTRLKDGGTPKISYNKVAYRDNKFAYVDPNFFSVFTLPFISGNAMTALKEPYTMVITKEQAVKYFGNEDPIGRTLDMEESGQQFKITGVIDNIPDNSHFHFDLFASMEGLDHAKEIIWLGSSYYNFLLLKEGYDFKELERKLPGIIEKYVGPQITQATGMSLSDFKEKGNEVGFFLQPLTDIHLYSDFVGRSEIEEGGDIKTVYIFGIIALFILLVACINFMNLSTAGASKRAKEVGIKKVLGSNKKQLIFQFLTESLIATFLAMVLATVLVMLSLPLFNGLSGKTLLPSIFLNVQGIGILMIIGLFVSILAGSYPAFFLSSFKPIAALKNRFIGSGNDKGLRNGLVVFQFVISAGLIVATLVVNQQMSFIQDKNVGYNKEQMLVLRDSGLLGEQENSFKEQLLNDPRVDNVTMSGFVPAGPTYDSAASLYPDGQPDAIRRTVVYEIDERYIPTMGMELVAGRNFSEDYGAESSNVILNETLVKIFGLKDNAIGQTITVASDNEGGTEDLTVIGVVKDFHFKSFYNMVDPLIMLNRPNSGLIVRAATSDMAGLISNTEKLWQKFNGEEPFDYALLDELYNQTYLKEQKIGIILRIFALLTIFVACLGLFGLVTFTAQRRFKEIGIRKVLGSSASQIVSLLAKDFLKLVMISMIIAFPLGYYLMSKWLQDFAYRIEIKWWIFALAGLITMLIAFLTISYRSIKVANANPVKSLRAE